MSDLEMLNYVKLAAFSAGKGQLLGRDRFLVLAGAAACHAGLLDIAATCRELVLQDNPQHLLGRFPTFPDALRGEDFCTLWKHLQRLCPPEQAEYLLNAAEISDTVIDDDETPAAAARRLLTA